MQPWEEEIFGVIWDWRLSGYGEGLRGIRIVGLGVYMLKWVIVCYTDP